MRSIISYPKRTLQRYDLRQGGSAETTPELPMGTMDLQMKLNSIGVGKSADRIPLKDDEERQLQVKLYASSPEEAHLLSLSEFLNGVMRFLGDKQ